MLRLYRDERLTLAAIGRAYGISTQRVHQCLCRIVGDAPFRTLRAKEVAP